MNIVLTVLYITVFSMSFRCVHADNSGANFIMTTANECLHIGSDDDDCIINDKLLVGCIETDAMLPPLDNFNYRVIVRGSNHYHYHRSTHSSIRMVINERQAYKKIRPYLSHIGFPYKCRAGESWQFKVTLIKYADDTFMIPVDIPLNDPVVALMSYYYSDNMRVTLRQ